MGWLFGKKKVPQVPLPEGHVLDEKALRFPKADFDSVIEPSKVKQAVGFGGKMVPPAPKKELPKIPPKMPTALPPPSRPMAPLTDLHEGNMVHIKIDLYQRILGEMDGLKDDLGALSNINRQLVSSEFNEDSRFQKLKRPIKSLHDNLLQIDKILFSSQGD